MQESRSSSTDMTAPQRLAPIDILAIGVTSIISTVAFIAGFAVLCGRWPILMLVWLAGAVYLSCRFLPSEKQEDSDDSTPTS